MLCGWFLQKLQQEWNDIRYFFFFITFVQAVSEV